MIFVISFVFLNRVSLKNLVYIGLRSIDPYERLIAKKFNIHLYGMRVSMNFHEIVEFHCLSQIDLLEIHKALDAMNRSSASGRKYR